MTGPFHSSPFKRTLVTSLQFVAVAILATLVSGRFVQFIHTPPNDDDGLRMSSESGRFKHQEHLFHSTAYLTYPRELVANSEALIHVSLEIEGLPRDAEERVSTVVTSAGLALKPIGPTSTPMRYGGTHSFIATADKPGIKRFVVEIRSADGDFGHTFMNGRIDVLPPAQAVEPVDWWQRAMDISSILGLPALIVLAVSEILRRRAAGERKLDG